MNTIKNLNWKDMEAWGAEIPAEVKETGTKYQDKTHWKNPISAVIIDSSEAQNLVSWINAFHGCKAKITIVKVRAHYPGGEDYFNMPAYEISSKGYSC